MGHLKGSCTGKVAATLILHPPSSILSPEGAQPCTAAIVTVGPIHVAGQGEGSLDLRLFVLSIMMHVPSVKPPTCAVSMAS